MSRDKIVDKSAKSCNHVYKAGDRVRVIGNRANHKIPIGTTVKLEKINTYGKEPYWYTDYSETGGSVYPDDIEPVESSKGEEYNIPEGYQWKSINGYSYVRKIGYSDAELIEKGWLMPLQEKEALSLSGSNVPFKEVYFDVKAIKDETNQQTKGDLNMSNTNRKSVVVNLIDRDSALDDKYSLVASFGTFTTSKSSEALIRSIIMDPKNQVAELIEQHNEVRSKQVNKEVLLRTGNKVMLEPVEESDLYWEIQ